jgi:hypothetical protein
VSIFTRAFNKLGYDGVAEAFPGTVEPQGPRWDATCVQFGSMRYRRCVTIVVGQDGLWLQAKPPLQGLQRPIFLPWTGIREVRQTLLYWRSAVRLTCGEPAAGAVTVWRPVWDAAGPLWEAARFGGAAAAPSGPPAHGTPPA